MGRKPSDVWQGTLALMVLKSLETMGAMHGYGIARRIEQTSGDRLSVNYGTLYPALLKLEQEGYVAGEWGVSEANRKARFYKLTRAGRKRLEKAAREWDETREIVAQFFSPKRPRETASSVVDTADGSLHRWAPHAAVRRRVGESPRDAHRGQPPSRHVPRGSTAASHDCARRHAIGRGTPIATAGPFPRWSRWPRMFALPCAC